MTKKDKKQKELGDIIYNKAKKDSFIHNSAVIGTGVGKSKIIIDLIEPLQEILKFKKILITVDNNRLKDFNWKEEFECWDKLDLFEKYIEINTYQTVYKWSKNLDDYLIIADEADFALTPEYSKFFKTYSKVNMIAMTGFVNESKRPILEEFFPCIVEYTQEQAQKDGLVNHTPIIFIKFDLGKDKNIKVLYAKGTKSFVQSENHAYNYWDSQVRILSGKIAQEESKAMITSNYKEVARVKAMLQVSANKRAEILLNSSTSIDICKRALDQLHSQDPDGKIVIFSKRTTQVDKITPHTYHGNNPDLVNNKNFKEFNKGIIKELGLVDKINRGVNMDNLKYAIFESYFSSDTKMRQRLGRMMRLDPDDLAYIFVLLPYFMRRTKKGFIQAPTAAVKWANTMLGGWDLTTSKTLDWRQIKSDL